MEGIICQKKGYLLQFCFVESGQKQNSDISEKRGFFEVQHGEMVINLHFLVYIHIQKTMKCWEIFSNAGKAKFTRL